jgi:hypothetical protein
MMLMELGLLTETSRDQLRFLFCMRNTKHLHWTY